jgi:nicotinate-nucleotide pyrophosphorylase (carboxylating)
VADVGPLYPLMYEQIVRRALEEDLGLAGDVTSDTVVSEDAFVRARLVARRPGRVAGLPVALSVFRLLCPQLAIVVDCTDGTDVPTNATIAAIEGPARPILTAERTALNLLSGLCGIATATRTAVEVVAGTRTRIVCTRKTTPGLRALEKYAVRVGGGVNHRFGLDDGVLIKDNHIIASGGIEAAVLRARKRLGHMVKIEIEVDTFEQLREVVAVGADAVLLDNMSPAQLREAVVLVGGKMVTEASGGITLANLGEIAAAGVDIVSLGWLTHSAPILDIGLDVEPLSHQASLPKKHVAVARESA